MNQTKDKIQKAYEALKADLGYKNRNAAPKLEKVVISIGTGSKLKLDKNKNEFIASRLARITGQKPALRGAKKSIATFKVRQGEPIGLLVTLRGANMYSFIDKLVHVALPRTKDFRGLNKTAIDNMGNITIGIKEHTIFPETGDEELKDVFGFAITIVSTAKGKLEAEKFFEYLGLPFKKEVSEKKK